MRVSCICILWGVKIFFTNLNSDLLFIVAILGKLKLPSYTNCTSLSVLPADSSKATSRTNTCIALSQINPILCHITVYTYSLYHKDFHKKILSYFPLFIVESQILFLVLYFLHVVSRNILYYSISNVHWVEWKSINVFSSHHVHWVEWKKSDFVVIAFIELNKRSLVPFALAVWYPVFEIVSFKFSKSIAMCLSFLLEVNS